MKRPITFLLTIATCVALTACAGAVPEPAEADTAPVSDTAREDTEPAQEDTEPAQTESEPEQEVPDYVQAYIDKAAELSDAGTADLFALIDVDGGMPALVAADSEGSYNDEGNVFLYMFSDGVAVELAHVTEGLDGSHMYISSGNGMILQTGSMMGNESYRIYSLNAGALDMTKELQALYDVENDSYSYRDGDTDLSEEQYQDEFAKAISANNPLTALDHDAINEVNITIKDGYVDFEQVSTQDYVSLTEITDKLVELGAKAP